MSLLSPLLRKEIRLLFPSFVVAMVLAVAPIWLLGSRTQMGSMDFIALVAFSVGAVLVAVAPFGQEFSGGTFSTLLVQPTPRSRIWAMKTGLALAALVVEFIAFVGSRQAFFHRVDWAWVAGIAFRYLHGDRAGFEEFSLILTLLALAGGLWTTLMFRQIGAAVFFTVLTPLTLFVAWEWVGLFTCFETVALTLYAGGAILWARRAFLRIQDAQRLSAPLSLPGRRHAASPESPASGVRRRTPLRTLLTRELVLHQMTLLVALVLLIFQMGTLVLRGFSGGSLPFAVQLIFAVAPLLWLFLPWLIGSVAVAEERRQGTLEGQLCLPVTRRRQFAVKLGTVLILAFLMGSVAPWGIEALGATFHIPSPLLTTRVDVAVAEQAKVAFPEWFYAALEQDFAFVLLAWSALAVGSALLAFFFSSLTRHMLHALAAAAMAAPVLMALIRWIFTETSKYQHYQRFNSEIVFDSEYVSQTFLWNGPLIFLIGGAVLTSAMVGLSFSNYQRSSADRRLWLHNLAMLAAALLFSGTATSLVFARPWERLMTLEPPAGPVRLRGMVAPRICRGFGRNGINTAVLLPDGRIWESGDLRIESDAPSRLGGSDPVFVPANGKIIARTGWRDMACSHHGVDAALQWDGSLWINKNYDGFAGALWPPDLERVAYSTDWKFVRSYGRSLFLKTDGTLWDIQAAWNSSGSLADPARHLHRVGTISDPGRHVDMGGVHDRPFATSPGMPEGASPIPTMPLGPFAVFSAPMTRRTDWIAAAAPGEDLGHASAWFSLSPGGITAAPLSDDTFVALAADGALCAWRAPDGLWRGSGLLGPSRRPLWCLNVLGDSATAGETAEGGAR